MTFCYTFTPIFIIYIDYIMRKVVITLVTLAFVSFAYAQDVTFDSFKRIESDKVLNLSADQIAKIKKLNREVGPKFKAIGQSNLPGYEKGQKKRALALEHKAAIKLSCQRSRFSYGKSITEVWIIGKVCVVS